MITTGQSTGSGVICGWAKAVAVAGVSCSCGRWYSVDGRVEENSLGGYTTSCVPRSTLTIALLVVMLSHC